MVLAGLVMLGILLSASSPSDSLARNHRSGKAVKKTTSHSVSHKRHAKFSSKRHRTPQRPLTASEKTEIIGKIKSLASAEVLDEPIAAASDYTQDMLPADVAQAAKEEREEDDVEVSMDRFFQERDATSVALNPDLAKSRESDFTLFDETDPKVTSTRSDVMQHIIDWVGTRYHFGGLSRDGIDCSAFTREVFRTSFNVELPRTASMQSSLGTKFGDLVFFHTAGYAKVTHVGIYVGEGLFANASCSRGVTVASLESKYWAKRYLYAKRLFTNTATAQADIQNSLKLAAAVGELDEDNQQIN
jgi:lipoprotein Spr